MTIYKYLKKYLGMLTLMLLVFSYSYSTIIPETDLKAKNLKGKVKSMTETTYNYGYSGKDNEVNKKKTIFNENGYIVEELYYDKNGNLVQTKRTKNETYKTLEKIIYNKEGKIIRTQTYTQNQYDKTKIKITDDSNYFKDKNGDLYQSLSDYSYIYDKKGRLEEIRDNIFSSGTIKYNYEYEEGMYVKTVEASTQKFVTYYDKAGNEVYYMWATWRTSQEEPRIQLYLVFKDTKRDKYGNLTYQVANRVEVVDITKGKGNDVGIYEKKVIEYEYYE